MQSDKEKYAAAKLELAKKKALLNKKESELLELQAIQRDIKKAAGIIAFLFFALTGIAQPSLHADLMQPDPQPAKTLFIFNSPKQAKTWTTVAGYALMATGGYLSGKAEMKSRYYGTTRNWDSFHVTRDAGLVLTGFGCYNLGASITIGEKPRLLEILWKLGSSALLYRITAEATYNAYKPRL